MFRMTLALSAAAILLAATGCQMCSHPYDNSGPVYDGCDTCPGGRVGSILDKNSQPCDSAPDGLVKSSKNGKSTPTAYASLRPKASDKSAAYEYDTASNWSPSPKTSRTSSRTVTRDAASNWSPRSRTPSRSASFDTADNWSPAAGASRGPSGRSVAGINGQTKPGYVPGSERIISVTERVVKPAAESTQVAGQPSLMADESSQLADQSSPESSKPLPSSGWTARRPTSEVLR
jgi:hypothetical protein